MLLIVSTHCFLHIQAECAWVVINQRCVQGISVQSCFVSHDGIPISISEATARHLPTDAKAAARQRIRRILIGGRNENN